MSSHTYIIPYKQNVLSMMSEKSIAVWTTVPEEIPYIVIEASNFRNQLNFILLKMEESVDLIFRRISYDPNWRNTPVVIFATELGYFPDFMRIFPLLRRLNIKICLPLDRKENYTNLRILSSLQIPNVALFGDKVPEWDDLNDLMVYAILGQCKHAPIEPFTYIATHFIPDRAITFNSIYFNDPSKFLYVSDTGAVGLSYEELKASVYIADTFATLGNLNGNVRYLERVEAWRQHFLSLGQCSCCEAWRICQGAFSKFNGGDFNGCSHFFTELMETAEQYQSLQKTGREFVTDNFQSD